MNADEMAEIQKTVDLCNWLGSCQMSGHGPWIQEWASTGSDVEPPPGTPIRCQRCGCVQGKEVEWESSWR